MTTTATVPTSVHGKGIIVGLLILLGIELYLHNDDFLHRYRSVFAVGRAADKIAYVAKMQPPIVFLGNSRVDNGIAPTVVSTTLGLQKGQVFNLGIPGLNTRSLSGIVRELEQRGALSGIGIRYILVGLDATLFSLDDELNYSVFFANRWQMLAAGEYPDLVASVFRLWGFSTNLKGLREPGRMRDFLAATLTDRDPWGGSVRANLGYRAKQDALTAAERDTTPDSSRPTTLSARARDYLLDALDRVLHRGIRVGVFFMPQYRRVNEFEQTRAEYAAYESMLAEMQARGVALFHVLDTDTYGPGLFSDPGHLNESGARRYSISLAHAITKQWPTLGAKP